jgi:ATP-dependent RNA helicase RhlE
MMKQTHMPLLSGGHRNRNEKIALEGVFNALVPELQRAVATQQYSSPTPIQEQCIPPLLEGKDIIGCAQTGTGKTAAFSLPLLQKLSAVATRPRRGTPRALILAPTRELAAQIGESIGTYGRYLRLSHAVIFGGVNQFGQVKALIRGVDILVATPGRLLDLIEQGHIHLELVEILVLDEVDKMLDMGFLPDIKRVLAKVPERRQTMFFSATLAPAMKQLAMGIVKNPVEITISPEKPTVESIDQKLLYVDKGDKDALLVSLLKAPGMDKAIVFTQMKHMANRVVSKLQAAGIPSAAIHGNKSQSARTKAMSDFKKGAINVMVATDVAARGIDVDNITHVFNYDLPIEAETYVHRIGRTARAGLEGSAVSFCSPEEKAYLKTIERLLGKPVPPLLDHDFHSDEALHSSQPAPKNFGRGQSRGPGRGGAGKRDGGGGGRPSRAGNRGGEASAAGSRDGSRGKDHRGGHSRVFPSRG